MSFKSLLLFVSIAFFAQAPVLADDYAILVDGTSYKVADGSYNGWQFTSNEDGTYNLVYAPVGSDVTVLTVPNKIEVADGSSLTISGLVTNISEGVFSSNNSIEEVIISSGIETVGSNAFAWCSKIGKVTFEKPSAVTVIGDYAFVGCASLKSITIPEGVTTIGQNAFQQCAALQSVTLPSTLTSIGSYAFQACTSLKSITFPDGLESIGSFAFGQCQSLTSVTIPASVKVVGQCAFQFCFNIASITIEDSKTNTDRVIEQYAFNQTAITEIYIPGSISVIESNAFSSCHGLTNITLGDGVDQVQENAFSDCNELLEIKLESKHTPPSLDPNAFTWHRVANGNVYVVIPDDASYSYTINQGSVTITEKTTDPDDPNSAKDPTLVSSPLAYYSLGGAKVASPKCGSIVIARYADGSARKMVVK
ncbi:leucine-rich repeat domain-containing protein [Salmonella enterica]|nr:leucine-rich repeat domain-containing protein [Salmonella enterica]